MAIHRLNAAALSTMAPGKHHDGGGLYLDVTSPTSASWVYRYQLRGHATRMGLGSYPEISLKRARELHRHFAAMRAEGIDPIKTRAAEKATPKRKTVKKITEEFFASRKSALKGEGEAGMWWSPVKNHVWPKLGDKTLSDLTIEMIVDAFQKPWVDVYPTATKAWSRFAQAVKFGADADFDLTILTKARARLGTPKHEVTHHAALEWKKAPALYRKTGGNIVDQAFKFYLLTIPRVRNVTEAVWDEFDLKKAIWHLPMDRMKTDRPFRVPLPAQVVTILSALKRGAASDYVFPSAASKYGVISLNTFNKRLKESSTAHGLRSTFGDWALDQKIADQALTDRCLAHQTLGKVSRAYLRTDLLEDRRVVMQKWADFLTGDTEEARRDVQETKLALHHQRRGLPPNEIMDALKADE